jgi:hypothetical protein
LREAASTISNELFSLLITILEDHEHTSKYLSTIWKKNAEKKGWMSSTILLYKMLEGLDKYQDQFSLQIMRRRVKEWRARAELLKMQVNKK